MSWTLLIILGIVALLALAVHDVYVQKKHAIKHNFPVIGHLRYLAEAIGPELRQYWVSNDQEELPFSRSERRWVYASAKGQNPNFGFGTSEQIYSVGYPIIKHAVMPFPSDEAEYLNGDKTAVPCLKIMGAAHKRRRPYRPGSIVNISAMSYGSLGKNAVSALNMGAKIAGCFHNTGEGGVSPYHLHGADLVWQLGTGYFGARGEDGSFSLDVLAEKCERNRQIRAIEIKLSQGAKPGKGGILPGSKVTPEIAAIRGVPVGRDVMSPNHHGEFDSVDTLIDFVETIAERTGLPVGIKSAIGEIAFWQELATKMKKRKAGPDFIAVDGGEGGTGAAPLTFSDHVSLPFKIGFSRVFPIFQEAGIAKDIVWIGSGKLGFPDRAVVAFAMGCDLINVARETMMSIGCIQAQKCHTGHCPAGVATHDKWLQAGLDVDVKKVRAARYLQSFRKELLSLSHAAGYRHPALFTGEDIEFSSGVNQFTMLKDMFGYLAEKPAFTRLSDYGPVDAEASAEG